MNWKERYRREVINTVNGITIYKDGFYIMTCCGASTYYPFPIDGGVLVKINQMNGSGQVNFNNRLTYGQSYDWEYHKKQIIREAHNFEIQAFLNKYPGLR